MPLNRIHHLRSASTRFRAKEQGYSLLALVIALAVFSIYLTMSVTNFQAERQQEQELELIQRGNSIAEAIARYNNSGRLGQLNPGGLFVTKLEDLAKGVDINGRLVHFLRPSALRDPMANGREWRALRVGDPLLNRYLQEWAAYYRQRIPDNYRVLVNPIDFKDDEDDEDEDEDDETTDSDDEDEDDEDDEDEDVSSSGGTSTTGETSDGTNQSAFGVDQERLPIVGVVSTSRKQAFQRQNGRDKRYDEFVFIYLPAPQLVREVPAFQDETSDQPSSQSPQNQQ